MQNVESSLWQQVADARTAAWPLRLEARRLRRDEIRALRTATRTLALTARDAAALGAAAAPHCAHAVAPAFPVKLPAGTAPQAGPLVCVAGSGGWWPNRQALDWLLAGVAPRLAAAGLPLHVFGGDPRPLPGVRWHAAPADAVDAFPAGAIAAVPLLIGSGLRMRLLEAWARGLPAVASRVAAAGLDVVHGRELLIADTAADFAAALLRLAAEPQLAASLVEAGRAYLRRHHDPERCTQALLREYALALAD
nr:glycosyltransferase [Tahibacter harae]